ncbi:hypothetical protein C8J56DRAFT_941921 [Mycena floridula]|nr:hypothetical protein C8J56DRAFT_941921 [Mycena floridula]
MMEGTVDNAGSPTVELSDIGKRLIANNEPPIEAEEVSLRTAVEQTELQIEQTVRDIARLEKLLQQAKDRHADLLQLNVSHRIILSPIRRVPSDVIFEILRLASMEASAKYSLPWVYLDVDRGPWQYRSICRHWRTVLISNPSLWSQIDILPGRLASESDQLEMLQMILDRSKARPLTIGFSTNFMSSYDWKRKMPQLEMLLLHSHRWVDITFKANFKVFPELSRLVTKESFPQLKRLDLTAFFPGFSSFDRHPEEVNIDCFAVAPALQSFHLNLSRLGSVQPNISVPWDQITDITITGHRCPPKWVHSLLALMPNILQCSVTISNGDLASEIIHLRYLTRLELKTTRDGDAEVSRMAFLHRLAIPSLEEFSPGIDSESELREFASFIERNHCSLKVLNFGFRFAFGVLSSESVERLALLVPTIITLNVEALDEALVDILTTSSIVHFPNLQKVDFGLAVVMTELRITNLLEMIRSRGYDSTLNTSSSATRLRHIRLKMHFESQTVERRFRKSIRHFEAQGLEVHMSLAIKRRQTRAAEAIGIAL